MKIKDVPDHIDPSLDLELARQQSLDLIKKRAYISAGAAVVPIPFLDVFVDLGVLSVLLPEINANFGLSKQHMPIYDPQSKQIYWKALAKRGFEFSSFVAARTIAKQSINGVVSKLLTKQVTKFVPLGGSIVAGTLGYLLMKKIAETHVEDCYQTAKQIIASQSQRERVVS